MSIFNFSNYKSFLKSHISNLPNKGRGEVKRIAEALKVNSTLISQILSGPRDFNLEQGDALTLHLGLSSLEREYFLLLLQKERAGTKSLRDFFALKIEQIKKASLEVKNRIPQDKVLTDFENSIFYSSHLYLAIWVFCSIDGGATVESICGRFEISRERAFEIVNFLLQTGMSILENNKYKVGPRRTHLERTSHFIHKHHANWRLIALQRSEDLQDEELLFTAPFSISHADFKILRENFMNEIKKLSERVGNTKPENIACVNLDLFWVKK